MELRARKSRMKWVEIIFNIGYLLTILGSASILYRTAEAGSIRWKFAMMALLLGIGDSFHLLPRIFALLDRGQGDFTVALGIGKLITSITMTIFYIFLWEIGRDYYGLNIQNHLSILVYGLALSRIILCLFPQNQWTSRKPSVKWGIIRNIPFLILGIMVMALFLLGTIYVGGNLAYLWLAILVSFICYMPVVLWVDKKPILGMLMLPKSCAYVAIVLMGFHII